MSKELILVTDWERVDKQDFYLTDEWSDHTGDHEAVQKARELLGEGKLYVGYIVKALDYAIYTQMDASQVFINDDMDVVLACETAVISNDHTKRVEYSY